jgi:hypothetical protein
VPYRVVVSERAAPRLSALDDAARREWVRIERTLSVVPYPQVRDRRIRRFRLADGEDVFLYAIPSFPLVVAYTVSEPPRRSDDGIVNVRAFIEARS